VREVKTLPLAELKIAGAPDSVGEFEGRASTFNTIDSYGDTIDPGAYAATLPEFLDRGFIGWSHDWDQPIGFLTAAEERADGLWITGQFHGDAEAQKYRQRARERVAAGKFMGLSIGFEAEEWEMRKIEESEDPIRALTKIKLYEVSLVAVPAERNSGVTTVKSGVPFATEFETARDAVRSAVDRAEQLVAMRESEGRSLNAENWDRISALAADWDEFDARFKELLAHQQPQDPAPNPDEEPDEEQAALRSIFEKFQQRDAFYTGVAWRT
jgi:hypothetical protein